MNQNNMLEKNRNILSQMLNKLPVHKPPADLWQNLESNLPEEERLYPQSVKLPQHQAPDHIWDQLNSALEYEQQETHRDSLKDHLEVLPLYRPPINHWYEIEVGLEQHETRKKRQKRRYFLSAAATITLMGLVFSAFMWISYEFKLQQSIPVAEQALPESSRLEEGKLIYSVDAFVQLLQGELDEINRRQDTLEAGLIPYSPTPAVDIRAYLEHNSIWKNHPELAVLQDELSRLDENLSTLRKTVQQQSDTVALKQMQELEAERGEVIQGMMDVF